MLTALLALLAVGCGSGEGDETAATTSPQTQTVTATAPEETGSERPAAPPIEGESLEGETIALADFRGRPVLVNVWSSW